MSMSFHESLFVLFFVSPLSGLFLSFFRESVFDIIEGNGTRFTDDRIFMIEQVLDLRSIIYHFANSHQAFVLDDWSFFWVLTCFE